MVGVAFVADVTLGAAVTLPETDSHYGCVFSVWDRLFGTTRKTQIEAITLAWRDTANPTTRRFRNW